MKNCERKRAHKQSNHRHRASNSKPSYKLTLRHLKVGRPGGKENLRERERARTRTNGNPERQLDGRCAGRLASKRLEKANRPARSGTTWACELAGRSAAKGQGRAGRRPAQQTDAQADAQPVGFVLATEAAIQATIAKTTGNLLLFLHSQLLESPACGSFMQFLPSRWLVTAGWLAGRLAWS